MLLSCVWVCKFIELEIVFSTEIVVISRNVLPSKEFLTYC